MVRVIFSENVAIMKRFLILSALFFLLAGAAQAQVGVNDSLNKGVSRTGGVYNGCDGDVGQKFSTRRGNDTLYPRVARTGELLIVTASTDCEIPGCGITENEALVNVELNWTGNYISRISSYGLKYFNHNTSEWTKKSYSVSICGDTTIQLKLQSLSSNCAYDVLAFVVLPTEDTVWSDPVSLVTKKHNRCVGWFPNDNESKDNNYPFPNSFDLVKDHEGNAYGVVQIGNRCWMRENMRAKTSPKNGNTILTTGSSTSFTSQEAHWYHNNAANKEDFGALYNWCAAADTSHAGTASWDCELPLNHRGICPKGWHLPADEEWTAMEKALNNGNDLSSENAGLLAGGCDWTLDNDANNSSPGNYQFLEWGKSDFNALPSGCFSGTMSDSSLKAYFWTSTQKDAENAIQRNLSYNLSGMNRYALSKNLCLSVRCIRDIPMMALRLTDGDCDKGNVEVVMNPDSSDNFIYSWEVNGSTLNGSSKSNSFDFTDETTYHVVCRALDPYNTTTVVLEASLDIEIPSFTPLVKDSAAAIIIQNPQNLTNAYWKLGNDTVSTATSGFIAGLQSGTYVVTMYNGDNVCRTKNNISVEVDKVYCSVASLNPSSEKESGRLYDGSIPDAVDSVKDASGYYYKVVQYYYNGKWNCWLRENMRATSSSQNSFLFGNVSNNNVISYTKGTPTDSSSYYYYDFPTTMDIPLRERGYLYSWKAANEVCPEGWHLPTKDEWLTLWNALKADPNYMNISSTNANTGKSYMMAAYKTKEESYWEQSNVNYSPGKDYSESRNKTLFSVVPAGNMQENGDFGWALTDANFWSTPKKYQDGKWQMNVVVFKNKHIYMGDTDKNFLWKPINRAFSVRCVRN